MVDRTPIRLVQFLKAFHLGGTEVQVVELLRALPRQYEVTVCASEATGPLLEEVWKMGHLPHEFPLRHSFMRPNSAWQIGRAAAWFRRNRIQIVHAHDLYATLLAAPAAKLAGAKLVVSRLDLAHFHSLGQRALLAQCTRWADRVVVNAEAIARMLVEEERVNASRIHLIHNGLDIARFDARMAKGLQAPLPALGRAPVGVNVANMNHSVKRQEDLLEAVAMLKSQGVDVELLLVGNGPRRGELEAYARSREVLDRVHFLGHRTDVPALYARANFGVLCSESEGLSNAVMEGMAASLPMVVTEVGGNPDLIEHGVRGWLVPKRRPGALARALLDVLRSPQQARERGRAARAFVEQELSLDRMAAAHDALYTSLASEQTEPAGSLPAGAYSLAD